MDNEPIEGTHWPAPTPTPAPGQPPPPHGPQPPQPLQPAPAPTTPRPTDTYFPSSLLVVLALASGLLLIAVRVMHLFATEPEVRAGMVLGRVVSSMLLPIIIGGLSMIRSPRTAVLAFAITSVALLGINGLVWIGQSASEPIEINAEVLEQLEEIGGDASVTSAEEQCILDQVGGQAIVDKAINNPQADRARQELIQAAFDCFEDPAENDLLAESLVGQLELGTDNTLDLENADGRCLVRYVIDNSSDPARTIAVADTQEDIDVLLAALELCLDPDEFGIIVGAAGTGPQEYGDNERFDALHDECVAGDDRTCDILWSLSSEGSVYNDVAFDCGGRGAGFFGWCTSGLEFDSDGWAIDGSPGIMAVERSCTAGDFTDCDLLVAVSNILSESFRTGDSCGGRITSALPDCRTRFGDE